MDAVSKHYAFDGYSFYHYNTAEQTYFNKDTRPKEFLELYEDMGGIYIDPVAYLSSLKAQIFQWDKSLANIELGETQTQQLGLAREFGIEDGISASVFSNGPYIGAVSWYSSSHRHVNEVYRGAAGELNTIVNAVVSKYESFIDEQRVPTLTPRERDVLHWVARGKTSDDIGDILAISTATVDTHLRTVLRKMQASNRSHAVAKAITYRIITL